MENKKITKKEYFNSLREVVLTMQMVGNISADEMVAFIDKQVEQLDKKASRAKEKAAEKKVEGDALREVVAGILTSEYQAIDDIVAQIDDEEVTKGKVVSRLTQLIEAGIAEKNQIKDEAKNRKVMAYRLKEVEAEVEAEAEVEE
jgi:hypothetical protein